MNKVTLISKMGGVSLIIAGIIEFFTGLQNIFLSAFLLFGLVALFMVQSKHIGWLGRIGLILGFLGTAFTTNIHFFSMFWQIRQTTRYIGQMEGSQILIMFGGMLVFLLLIGLMLLGWILLGIATFRAKVLPSWAGILMIILLPMLALPGFLRTVFPISLVMLGVCLLTAKLSQALHDEVTVQKAEN